MRCTALAIATAAVVLLIGPAAAQGPQPNAAALLDHYAAGRFEEALRPVSNMTAEEARRLRDELMTSGRLWIDRPGELRSRRLATAAMLALEVEAVWAERGGWVAPTDAFCAGRCLIEWACALLHERGDPDRFEHDWHAATASLAAGVRDWGFLFAPLATAEPFGNSRGHINHALARFPGDPAFRFARALAMASRFEVTTETDAPRDGVRLPVAASGFGQIVIGSGALGSTRSAAAVRRANQRALVMKELAALAEDPVVGAAARIRLAHLQWAAGAYESALTEAQTASNQTRDDDLRYLANYIAGRAAESIGDLSKAESLYAAALGTRPNSQSASVALAALRFQRGDAAGAYTLVESSFEKRKNDDDPWRLFQYGDYATLAAKIQELRRRMPSEAK